MGYKQQQRLRCHKNKIYLAFTAADEEDFNRLFVDLILKSGFGTKIHL